MGPQTYSVGTLSVLLLLQGLFLLHARYSCPWTDTASWIRLYFLLGWLKYNVQRFVFLLNSSLSRCPSCALPRFAKTLQTNCYFWKSLHYDDNLATHTIKSNKGVRVCVYVLYIPFKSLESIYFFNLYLRIYNVTLLLQINYVLFNVLFIKESTKIY